MTFEEEYPSLPHGLCYCGSKGLHRCAMVRPKIMFSDAEIKEHCLDKQRVKEVLEQYILFLEKNHGIDTEAVNNIQMLLKELGL